MIRRDWREENVDLLMKSNPENVRAACVRCAEVPGSEEDSKTGRVFWCPTEGH